MGNYWTIGLVLYLILVIWVVIFNYAAARLNEKRGHSLSNAIERLHMDTKRRSMEGVNRDTGAKRSSWELPTGGKSTARHVWRRDRDRKPSR